MKSEIVDVVVGYPSVADPILHQSSAIGLL